MTSTHVQRRWLEVTLALGIVLIFAQRAFAEDARPVSPRPRTVAEVLSDPVRDELVSVRGTIVRRVAGNDYVLDDGTGKLIVDGGPIERHSLDLPIDRAVDIIGEVSLGPRGRQEGRPPEISIFSVTKADGTVLQVRTGPKPEWAASE